jgi:L-seryl-tRNA(Ser) seleniumtransferase
LLNIQTTGRMRAPLRICEGQSVIGGGANPEQSLPTCLIVIENENAVSEERRLRFHDPPIVTRIERDRVVLDLRTVLPDEETAVAEALSHEVPTLSDQTAS